MGDDKDDLFVSLRRYVPRPGKDPLENFVTAAFSWIIENNQPFAKWLIQQILDNDFQFKNEITEIKCNTQVNFDGVYPDMVIEFNNITIIFEHKVWASLHENQIENYEKYAKKNFGKEKYKLVLITANQTQHTSRDSVINLCWSDIHEIINNWLSNADESENPIFFRSFLRLLKDVGVGPPIPVEYAEILFYNIGKKLVAQIEGFLSTLQNKYGDRLKSLLEEQGDKKCGNCSGHYALNRWGRYGFEFCDPPTPNWWNPSLFIGFLLDTKDHKVEPVDENKSPDFSLIVDFNDAYHEKYPTNDFYLNFKKDIRSILETTKFTWDMYDIADHNGSKNKWHPLHIRVPMREIFVETENIDSQADRFFQYTEDIVPKIIALPSLQKMKEEFQ